MFVIKGLGSSDFSFSVQHTRNIGIILNVDAFNFQRTDCSSEAIRNLKTDLHLSLNLLGIDFPTFLIFSPPPKSKYDNFLFTLFLILSFWDLRVNIKMCRIRSQVDLTRNFKSIVFRILIAFLDQSVRLK